MSNNNINSASTQYGIITQSNGVFLSQLPGSSGLVFTSSGNLSPPAFKTFPGINQVLVSSQSASSSSSIVFNNLPTAYKSFFITWSSVLPQNNGDNMAISASADNGGTYPGLSDTALTYTLYNSSSRTNVGTGTDRIPLTTGMSSTIGCSGFLLVAPILGSLLIAAGAMSVSGQSMWYDSSSSSLALGWVGGDTVFGPINAFKFTMSTGNIDSGTFNLYGITY